MLDGMLDTQREAVARILSGLDDTASRTRLVPSLTTLAFLAACERSREIAAGRPLDEQFTWHRRSVSLRYIYVHLIAELARHAGHGDILVEQLKAGSAPTR